MNDIGRPDDGYRFIGKPMPRTEDVRLMREAGVNLATVGVFSWALLEPLLTMIVSPGWAWFAAACSAPLPWLAFT